MQSPPSSDTQIHKFSRIPLVIYSLWCVRLCSLSLKALNAAPACVRVAALVYVLRRRAHMSGSSVSWCTYVIWALSKIFYRVCSSHE